MPKLHQLVRGQQKIQKPLQLMRVCVEIQLGPSLAYLHSPTLPEALQQCIINRLSPVAARAR